MFRLADWFKKARDQHIAHQILAKAEQIAKAENDLMSLHFVYVQLGEIYYREREDPTALDPAINAFTQQISIALKIPAAII